jgi:predicted transcriptional regulator
MANLPESIEAVVDRMDANIPTDITAVNEAIAQLDDKFKELEAYKNDPKRTHTTEQIDEVIDLLDSTKKELQYYQEAITNDEGAIKDRTTAEGIAEAKANEVSPQAEAKPAEEVAPQVPVAEVAKAEVPVVEQASKAKASVFVDIDAAMEARGTAATEARAAAKETHGKENTDKAIRITREFDKIVKKLENEGMLTKKCP